MAILIISSQYRLLTVHQALCLTSIYPGGGGSLGHKCNEYLHSADEDIEV